MKKEDLENIFNIGIPCYNHTFVKVQDLTNNSYIKGVGNLAINKERELRNEGKKLIRETCESDAANIILSSHDDGIFHYVSLASNISDSKTNFGFLDEAKLCSIFYPQYNIDYNYCKFNIDELIDKNINENNNEKLKRLYDIRKILLSKDYSELETEYFNYLETNKVINLYIQKLTDIVNCLISQKKIPNAQTYLFTLSAYVKKYGDFTVKINGNNESLKSFVKAISEKYPLKNEYLYRSGFINRSKEENDKIIETIMNKTDIVIDRDLCESGYKAPSTTNHTDNKRRETTEEEIVHIGEVLNDRMMFYLSLGPIGEIKPSGAFSKYGAFIYPNGIIVADRLYDVNTIGSLSQDAIYKFNALNFEERSKLSKTELTSIPNSKFYHTDTWKKRTGDYIQSNTPEEMHEKAKVLIKG